MGFGVRWEMGMNGVLVRITTAMMKHCDQEQLGGKGLFNLYFHITVHHQGRSGQGPGGRS